MTRAPRPAWSWTDVAKAAPAGEQRLTIRPDAATYAGLRAMAQAGGVSVNALAASILQEVVEDDAAAHAGGA